MATIEDDRLYTVTEVAVDQWDVNYRTVLNEIHAGNLYALRVGPKPLYRIPGWALRDYQRGRAPRPTSLVASIGTIDEPTEPPVATAHRGEGNSND